MRRIGALVLFLAGCPAPIPSDGDASQSSDASSMADLVVTGGCNPKGSGLTPLCNATNHCVAGAKHSACAMGSYRKIISGAIASCGPSFVATGQWANHQKCGG